MPDSSNEVIMEDMQIGFRNFAGREGQYNREGDRNFAVFLPEDVATKMLADGWNVKYLKPKEVDEGEDEYAQPYLSVTVKFGGFPPRIYMITTRGRTRLGEDEVDILDDVEVVKADMIIRPYEWAVRGNSGVKAYLKSLYVTINEDPLERKYAEMDAARGAPLDD